MSQQGNITINGFVAADPVSFGQAQGIEACSFRLGCTRRHYNSTKGEWIEHPTTWMTVKAFRSLATNIRFSVHKGDPVVVTGVLNTENWQHDGTSRSRIVVEAAAVGHDLALGVSSFQRTKAPNRATSGNAEAGGGDDETDVTIDAPATDAADPFAQNGESGVGSDVGSTIEGDTYAKERTIDGTITHVVQPAEHQLAEHQSTRQWTDNRSEAAFSGLSEYATSAF